MKYKLNDQNSFSIDCKSGKITALDLSGQSIIQDTNEGLGSGSYLLYPWVNRIIKNPYQYEKCFTDSNNYPLHGFYTSSSRICKIIYQSQNMIQIQMKPQIVLPQTINFVQIFTMKEDQLIIEFEAQKQPKLCDIPFCFGYHPYFKLNNQPISQLQIKTNLNSQILLNDHLIPVYPWKLSQLQAIDPHRQYDNLFMGTNNINYVKLYSPKQALALTITSSLPYWQIYTPTNKQVIAIQPMSFCGNIYEICQIDHKHIQKLPHKAKISISVLHDQQK